MWPKSRPSDWLIYIYAVDEILDGKSDGWFWSLDLTMPSLYKHFVDDGFGVFRDKTHAETYLEYVNSLSSDLVYTIEHPSQDGSIPFLDILIHKDLSTSVYRKPTHIDTYTHYSTAAPQTTKDSLIRSLTRRAYNICSPQHVDLEPTHVNSVLLDNGYPLNHINLIMHRTKNSLSKPKTPRAKDNGNLANISVPYYPALSKPLRQISDRHNISLTFTRNVSDISHFTHLQ